MRHQTPGVHTQCQSKEKPEQHKFGQVRKFPYGIHREPIINPQIADQPVQPLGNHNAAQSGCFATL